MATEDVLERIDALRLSDRMNWPVYRRNIMELLDDLAAEVRELRKDKARLDELEKIIAMRRVVGGPWEGCLSNTRAISAHSLRDLADAAMEAEHGE